ncbi:MAG: EAL domain-containing protein, partial [Burkholderiales bacterium]
LFLRAQEVRPIADDALDPYYEILLGIEPQPGLDVEPTSLVTAIERLGRSAELDLWVMREVLDWVEAHPETFARIGGFAINVSPLSLGSPEILRFLDARLARPGVPAGKLTFELTETAAIDSYGAARDFIQRVRRHGCRVSLDDFGSGYASYSHLKNLRTDSLKIDGAFVRDMLESPSDRAMVKSMHEVARSLGIRTVAEYVESPAHLEALREIGIDYAQGYAIHKPARLDTLLGD